MGSLDMFWIPSLKVVETQRLFWKSKRQQDHLFFLAISLLFREYQVEYQATRALAPLSYFSQCGMQSGGQVLLGSGTVLDPLLLLRDEMYMMTHSVLFYGHVASI